MRVFVSHAIEDKPLALQLTELPEYIDRWIDIEDLIGGQELDPTILLAIEESHLVLVLLSKISITKGWVLKELEWALAREDDKDRVFVLPIIIDPDVKLEECEPEVAKLGSRLYLDASDTSAAGIENSRDQLYQTLFQWACDWIEQVEPKGTSGTTYIDKLESRLIEYQTRLFALKAALSWPLDVLIKPDAVAHFIMVKDRYNDYTKELIPSLVNAETEIRWRFGRSAQRSFMQLSGFLKDKVFHGAAFALNDVIESLNTYESVLAKDAEKLKAADQQRQDKIEELEPVMTDLVRRTSEFVETLKL